MKVICYGDSNTYGYDPRSMFGDPYDAKHRWVDLLAEKTGWEILNWGLNGRDIPVEPVPVPGDINLFIVMLGTNDLLQFWPPEETAAKMENFLKSMELEPEKILLIAPPPMTWGAWVQDQGLIDDSIALAEYYRILAERLGILFLNSGQWNISLAFDGVHMTEEGNDVFANELYDYISAKRLSDGRWHESTGF